MKLLIDGRERTVNLSFDGTTSLADARALISRAWSIYEDPTAALEPCNGPAKWHSRQQTWAEKRAGYPLDSAATEINVSISHDPYGTNVSLFGNDLVLTFRRDPDNQAASSVCWGEWIVIT